MRSTRCDLREDLAVLCGSKLIFSFQSRRKLGFDLPQSASILLSLLLPLGQLHRRVFLNSSAPTKTIRSGRIVYGWV